MSPSDCRKEIISSLSFAPGLLVVVNCAVVTGVVWAKVVAFCVVVSFDIVVNGDFVVILFVVVSGGDVVVAGGVVAAFVVGTVSWVVVCLSVVSSTM